MEENKHESVWMVVSFTCALMFFLLIAIVGLIVVYTDNQWLILPVERSGSAMGFCCGMRISNGS